MIICCWIISEINECAANYGPCQCQYACTNLCGSFSCSCGPGYASNGLCCDGMNCIKYYYWLYCGIV